MASSTAERFADRHDAGVKLAGLLQRFAGRPDVVVLALPRGGVPVAYEVARLLDVPLDIFAVRKLGAPGHEELAMGAIGSNGTYVLNYDVIDALNISRRAIVRVAARERRELERREAVYRADRPPLDVTGKTVILVDDGLATGATMTVAVAALRKMEPAAIVVAVPVAAPDVFAAVREAVEDAECYEVPRRLDGVGSLYADFSQTSDDEVRSLLERAADSRARRDSNPQPLGSKPRTLSD